jgi:hypothetical protein
VCSNKLIYSAPFACRHYISSRINSGFLLWQIIDGRVSCDGSRIRYRFLRQNSLVGYDSLMEEFSRSESWQSFYDNFRARKSFRHPSPLGPDSPSRFRFCSNRSYFSRQLVHFMFHATRRKTQETLPTSFIIQRVKLHFSPVHFRRSRAVFMKHFQGGHVMKCKQIS